MDRAAQVVSSDRAAALHMLAKDLVRIVIDKINLRSGLGRFPRRANDKRGLTPFRNGKCDVVPRNTEIGNLLAAELRKIFEPFNRLYDSEIAAGHDAEGAVFEFRRGRRAGQSARSLALPEIAPNGNELDAQPPGRSATGEENLPAVSQGPQHRGLDRFRLSRLRECTVPAHHVLIDLKQQLQRLSDVAFGCLAQICCDRVRCFGGQNPKLELMADPEELLRTDLRSSAHQAAQLTCAADGLQRAWAIACQ